MDKKSSAGASYNARVCHVMPCSIEEDMTAPTAVYFRPTPLPAEALSESCGRTADEHGAAIVAAQFRGRGLLCAVDSPSSKSNAPSGTAAATGDDGSTKSNDNSAEGGEPSSSADSDGSTTRPRPALSRLPSGMTGVVLAASTGMGGRKKHPRDDDATANTRPLRVVERFDQVFTWQHEHSVEKVVRDQCLGGAKADRCGLRAARAWMELADAVHGEIPLP